MAGKDWTRQAKHSLLNKHLQADTASGFSARHRPQNKRPQMTGLAANKQPQMTSASRRAGKWEECNGAGSHQGGLRPT